MGCASSTEVAASSAPATSTPNKGTAPNGTAGAGAAGGSTATKQQSSSGSETMGVSNSNTGDGDTTNCINSIVNIDSPPGSITCEGSSEVTIGDFKLRYGCISQRGRDPDSMSKPNQDSYSVDENFTIKSTNAAFFGVYDGHGPQGEKCAQFTQQRLPVLAKQYVDQHIHLPNPDDDLNLDDLQEAMFEAHTTVNRELRKCPTIDDAYSGTTSISILMNKDNRITVCNVGDSRAVLGTTLKGSLQAVALSKDQTPRRPDEAKRCELAGARILSFGQIDPSTKDDDDDVEDPPRVWSMKGHFPGTAFTRSIGDAVAESLGVSAEPEMLSVKMTSNEKVIVLASDGIYDVLGNDQVINITYKHRDNPRRACHALVEKAHEEWLLNDDCTEESASYDDMTAICIFIDDGSEDKAKVEVATTTTTTTTNEESNTSQKQERKKRVRQKTLRNLEEGKEENFFG